MASTKKYRDFIMEQLSGLDEVSCRAMMGEYVLYYRGKVFGGIYDDRLLVKPVPAAVKIMPDASMELPYSGRQERPFTKIRLATTEFVNTIPESPQTIAESFQIWFNISMQNRLN